MIVNYRLDTTYTLYPFYTVQEIKLEGTAAKMDVGEQAIGETSKDSTPKAKDQSPKRKK